MWGSQPAGITTHHGVSTAPPTSPHRSHSPPAIPAALPFRVWLAGRIISARGAERRVLPARPEPARSGPRSAGGRENVPDSRRSLSGPEPPLRSGARRRPRGNVPAPSGLHLHTCASPRGARRIETASQGHGGPEAGRYAITAALRAVHHSGSAETRSASHRGIPPRRQGLRAEPEKTTLIPHSCRTGTKLSHWKARVPGWPGHRHNRAPPHPQHPTPQHLLAFM
ncbi:hypothetical protein AAFF_G00217550 [Aldrovandia affinis]|uniref:Uncharacterized protein n=1 Tax=Aldrovandia affinis TaxID=143900 RepID=A0AAD7SVV0_9TELE|nr:hypothetical protein AAFF_G00217550 [Aldrovandia affinis]